MVNPPAPTDPSGQLFAEERKKQLDSLKRRSIIVNQALNGLSGVIEASPFWESVSLFSTGLLSDL